MNGNSWKLPSHGKGDSQTSLGGVENPRQEKPKEEYTVIAVPRHIETVLRYIVIKPTKIRGKNEILKPIRENSK